MHEVSNWNKSFIFNSRLRVHSKVRFVSQYNSHSWLRLIYSTYLIYSTGLYHYGLPSSDNIAVKHVRNDINHPINSTEKGSTATAVLIK